MAPRNRHGTGTSPSPTPSSTPPTAGLTKRQRQALRINRPPPSASPLASSPPDLHPDVDSDVPSVGTSPASLPVEGIRIRHIEEREERASPSKYPTPLPDEEEDDDELPVPAPFEEEEEQEQAVFEVADIDNEEGASERVDVPTGALIDVDEGEPEPLVPVPKAAEVKPMPESQAQGRPKEMNIAIAPQSEHAARQRQRDVDTDTNSSASPRTSKPPVPVQSRRRRSPPSPPFVAPAPPTREGNGYGHGHGAQAHLRAPEAPRHPPPRALSALSHTLRALAAAGTQAVTAYANGVGSEAHLQHHLQPRRSGGGEGVQGEDGEGEERIVGARWDEVDVLEGDGPSGSRSRSSSTSRTRRLLTLTYAAGVQVWDASVLGGVEEVVNLRIPASASVSGKEGTRSSVDTLRAVEGVGVGASEPREKEDGEEMTGPILSAAILPSTSRGREDGGLELGILTPHTFYVYALGSGRVVGRAGFPTSSSSTGPSSSLSATVTATSAGGHGYGARAEGEEAEIGTPCAFEAAERVIVVTTHSPPALVVLARPSLRVLHVFPASTLAVPYPSSSPASDAGHRMSFSSTTSVSPPYGTPPHSHILSGSPSNTTSSTLSPTSPPPNSAPTPISALHGRLLAFLAPPPTASPVLSATGAPLASWGRTLGRFFSRSAPAASALAASVFSGAGSPPLPASLASVAGAGGVGAWVRVVDLAPLLSSGGTKGRKDASGRARDGGGAVPHDVHAFEAGRAAVGGLSFARDGTHLFVVRRDGLGASVWALRPSPLRHPHPHPHPHSPAASDELLPAPTHVYALRRGRTGAVVESVAGARDGRFVALATRRRTVHVFAVNPYGGRADVRSHLGGRVRDAEDKDVGIGVGAGVIAAGVDVGEEGPTEVHALVRMRLPLQQQQQQQGDVDGEAPPPPAPLAIAFVPPVSTTSNSGTVRSPTIPASPGHSGANASGVQDVLVFDPADGVLSLRRVTLSLEPPHAAGLPISVSLPAAVAAGRISMSASPPSYAASYARGAVAGAGSAAGTGTGAGAGGGEAPGELGGREAVVATWSLRRKRGWAEIRRAEGGAGEVVVPEGRSVKEDWLAQAELSTFTSAPRVLPRAIYLSHQFAFYTLGEDYHALIRRYQFAIGGAKIDVRREVEVSAFAFGAGADASANGEAFVEGYGSSPRAIRRRSRASSSFDEPLASALAGTHYRDARPPPVLPMLPNGSPASFRSSMPVRAVAGLGDNVAEGLGRLRREMRHQRQKQLARSPPARKAGGVGGGDDIETSVPLEFDEEDEDFAAPVLASADDTFLRVHADRAGEDDDIDALSATTSRNGEESVASISTPATSAHPLDQDEQVERMEQLDLGLEGEWAGNGWAAEDKQAVEEAERFDDISVVGFLDEEQAAMQAQVQAQAEAARRKGPAARSRTKKRK